MAWSTPRFGTIAAAIDGGTGSMAGGDFGAQSTVISAGSSFDNLRTGRTGTATTFEADGSAALDWVSVDLDRGAGTNPTVDALVVLGPKSTTPDPTVYGIYAYVYTTADLSAYFPLGGYSLAFAGAGTAQVHFGQTTARYLRFMALTVGGSISTMTARQFVYTNYIGAGTTKRGPEPGWTDEFRHAVAVSERPSGWVSSHDFGARRTFALTYSRVSDATDRAVLEAVVGTPPNQPFIFWPSFSDELPRLVRLADFDIEHAHPTPARLSGPEPTYRIQLEDVIA